MGCEPEVLNGKSGTAKPQRLDLPPGVPPLTSLYMYIAGSCNLACRHCWIEPDFRTDNKSGKFIKLEHVKKAVKEAKPLGLQSVKLTGGEPVLHPHFLEIINFVNDEQITISVETNGVLINDEIAGFLKSKPYCRFISVSIDGARQETHDELRGIPGAFDNAVKGLKALSRAGFHPQLICTLHKGNVGELEKVVEFAQVLGCGSVKFNHVQPMGRGDGFDRRNTLSVPELIAVFKAVDGDVRKKSSIPVYFDIPFAFYPLRKILHEPINRCNVLNLLGILADGKASLCGIGVTVPELVFGDISSDALDEIWLNAPGLATLRKNIPHKLQGICANCLHKEMCMGQCVAINYHTSGNLNAPYSFCKIAEENGNFPETRKKLIKMEAIYGKQEIAPQV